ncbi:decapping and exoribonuclease protein-like [Diadema setosum]|uniref:decapping and exoribonuclease protein-like n=1 Tax=Diadema setosum TaxID=31175 RepID=UPI003B3BC7BC
MATIVNETGERAQERHQHKRKHHNQEEEREQDSKSPKKQKLQDVDDRPAIKDKKVPIKPFPVKPIHRFQSRFPFFREPTEIGHFSLDEARRVHCDARLLKVYTPPKDPRKTHFDLRKGYKEFIKRDDDDKERLNNLTTWMLRKRSVISRRRESQETSGAEEKTNEEGQMERLKADFVMWRGHMTKFLCTPYENREGWAMAVTLFRGTYYISEVETEENRRRRKEMSEKENEMSYWGYKFEQYVTSDDGKTASVDTSKPVNSNEAFCSVIQTRLGSHSLIYSGEVDCRINRPGAKSPANYVELKTSRIWYTHNNERNFYRFKLIKWWAQSFLVGIPEVICGFRDDDGVVHRLESFRTFDMPDSARGAWDGAVCFNFADQLLSYVKEIVTIDNPRVAYMLERAPGSSEVTCVLHEDGTEQFLTEEFISSFR